MINDRRFLLAIILVAVASVAAMPILLRTKDAELAKRRTEIAKRSQAERERLERNFERYQHLPEEQRVQYRQLHADLEADVASNHGRANAALQSYRQWLQTISPRERDDLQHEDEPAAKVRLIRTTIEHHHDEQLEIRSGETLRRLGPIPLLKPQDLASMLSVIHEAAESKVPAEDLEGYEGLHRTLKLFELLGRKNLKLTSVLTEERLQSLTASISDDTARQLLVTVADDRPAPLQAKRAKLAITLWRNLELAVQREVRRRDVTFQALEKVLADLPEDEQNELLELSASQFRAELRRRHVDTNSSGRINRWYVDQFLRPGRDNRSRRRDGATPNSRRDVPSD